jgi:hypothetical protein
VLDESVSAAEKPPSFSASAVIAKDVKIKLN